MIENYLFLTTSHDGSGSITAAFTPIRIVCQNTLNAALKGTTGAIKIRHTANAKQRLDQAHKILGMTNTLTIEMEGIYNHWANVRITDKDLQRLIQLAMVPNKETLNNLLTGKIDDLSTLYKNTCNDVYEYAMSSDSQQLETTKGTVFGAYNAVTGYFQNVRRFKNDEAKVQSLLMGGTGQLRSQNTFNLCNDFAKVEATFFSLINHLNRQPHQVAALKSNLMKPLHNLDNTGKGRLLVELFPLEIPRIIAYMKEAYTNMVKHEQQVKESWTNGFITANFWYQNAAEVMKVVAKWTNPELVSIRVFSDQLFHDLRAIYTIDCIVKYAEGKSDYPKFQKMVSILFDYEPKNPENGKLV